MNPLTLAQEIIDGRRITREDDLSFFLTCDLDELCEGADRIREACIGDKVDLCSIINGRSGRCPEDCKYCAQSAHHHTSCEVYNFLPEEKILAIDADPAIGLATALGIEPELTLDDIRNEIVANVEDGNTKEAMELLSESRYKIAEAIVEKEGFAFLAIGRPESAGCYCRINSYLKEVITMISEQFDYVVIDGEAGIEQINRRVMEKVTHLLLISDTSKKGLEVIKTIENVAMELVKYDRIGLIVNRVEDPAMIERLDTRGLELLAAIPSDKKLALYDFEGRSIMELPEESPVVVNVRDAMQKFGILP